MNKIRIIHLVCIINHSINVNKKFLVIPFSIDVYKFINKLYIEDYIEYVVVKNNTIFFKIKYFKGKPIIKKIQFISKKGQKKVLSYKNFWNFSKDLFRQSFFFTNKGLLSGSAIKKLKIGGNPSFIIII